MSDELKKFALSPGDSSPVFTWSPLPPRKQLSFTDRKELIKKVSEDDLYPNCDVDVWLRSCEEEIIEPLAGTLKGEIPSWLEGTLLRNGPGSLKVGNESYEHIFDSSALLHRFNISGGKISYQCRFLKSDVYKRNSQARRIVRTEFGTKAVPDPCHSIFDRISSIFNTNSISDNSMISVYPFGDEIFAFGETPIVHKINEETLDTEKRVDLNEYISIVHHTSHPHVLENGDVLNLAMSINARGPHFNIVRFPSSSDSETSFQRAEIVATIPSRWSLYPSYMHTFGLTGNYFVIVEQPLNLAATAVVITKLRNDPFAGCFRWYPEEYTQINVISRKDGTVYKFFAQAFFFLHIINQYEISDHLVIDICIYRDPSMLDCLYVETMKAMHHNPDYAKMFRGRPARFVLPLNPTKNNSSNDFNGPVNLVQLNNTKAKAFHLANGDIFVEPERLCHLGCETPRIHYERFLGKPYRYFYAISSDVDAENPGTIVKVDIQSKSAKKWCEPNCYPSEPIFVPSPEPKCEDDGLVMSAMIWGGGDRNHVGIIILDAVSFKEMARAEFYTPSPVPKCLHGWFVNHHEKNHGSCE